MSTPKGRTGFLPAQEKAPVITVDLNDNFRDIAPQKLPS
ncbi:hypothetical protein Y888_12155 [Mixta calida B021323]|nr:hypothetical protein Y888_12155 [Mixta calida B021323]